MLARDTLMWALGLEEKIILLVDNYYEWEVELLKLAEAQRIWPGGDHSRAMQERLLLDRRLVNFLTACRLYMDHSEHAASSLFGEDSPGRDSLKARKAKAYDEHFGYRFMEALRNYVQHRNLAVNSISYQLDLAKHGNVDFQIYAVTPGLEISELEEGGLKPSVLDEAKTYGASIDLRQPVREYVSEIRKLHLALREEVATTFAERFSFFESLVENHKEYGGRKVRFARAVTFDESGKHISEVALEPVINIC